MNEPLNIFQEVRLLGVPSTEPHQIFEKKSFFIHASIEPDLYMKPEVQPHSYGGVGVG